jgi:DNA-binding NarL/FixJ family response regulator
VSSVEVQRASSLPTSLLREIRDSQDAVPPLIREDVRVGVSVLIVDDHATFRRFARRLLEQAGFAVIGEAVDGAAALEAAGRLAPGAILLDVLLPDASGLEIAVELATEFGAIAVVLTSSRSASDLGAALAEAPARGFIAKSDFSTTAFAALVDGDPCVS